MIRSGEYKTRARIQKSTITRDAEGGEIRTWSTFKTVWCKVTPSEAKEFVSNLRQESQIEHKVEMRWVRGVTAAMRLKIRDKATGGDRMLNIGGVMDEGDRHEKLTLSCKEGQ